MTRRAFAFAPFASFRSRRLAAALVGAALLVGCQAEDGTSDELFDRMGLFAGEPDAEGRFETRIWDMDDGTARLTHHLVVDGEATETQVVFDEDAETLHNQLRDAVVAVHGTWESDGVLLVDDYDVVQPAPVPVIDPQKRDPRRIATILTFWTQQTLSNAEARERMFLHPTNPSQEGSVNEFYRENSYGVEKIAGNVFGPYQIPDPGGCNTGLIKQGAMAAFLEKGHNPDDYRQFMYHFQDIGGCGFAGLANLGSPDAPAADSWYNGSFSCTTRVQEIGHNYGMRHSNSYTCQDAMGMPVVYSDDCSTNEYGDNYDPMGGGCAHMNVMQKSFMGWLQGCNVTSITSNGTFNLVPTELPCNGIQALEFAASTGESYFLEYRQPLGEFDGGNDGVLVHVGHVGVQNPNILYGVAADGQGFMQAGESFSDPMGTVTFTVTETHSTHAVIDVQFADGGDGAMPQCEDGETITMEGGNWGTLECAAEPFPLDVVPPTVEITYPNDGDYFLPGSDFFITAEASDDDGVTELTLYLDNEPLFSSFEPPWEWEVTNIPEGTYQFGVLAWDGPNNAPSNGGQAITIYVTNDIPTPDTTGGSGGGSDGSGGPIDPTDPGDGSTTGGTEADPSENVDDGGCACRSDVGRPPRAMWLLLVGLGAVVRRRRR